ncbi:MAG: tetratricopeptide repeat protein [Bryobacteraceae bacterium]
MSFFLICCLLAQVATSAYQRGLEAYSKDDLREAERSLKLALQADRNSFATRFLLGATLVRMDRADEAIPELEIARKLNPRNADVVKLLAIQYMERNRRTDSLRLLQAFPEAARDEEVYLLLIEANQDAGSVDEVGRLVERAVKRYPGSARLNAWMGFEMRQAARFAEAQSYLRKALQQDPSLAAPYFLIADVLVKTEKYSEALPWLRKAIQLDPDDTEAAIDLSRVLVGLGDLPGAVRELEQAFRKSPENANLAVELARTYARAGELEKARTQAEIAGRLRHRENVFPDSLRLEKRK